MHPRTFLKTFTTVALATASLAVVGLSTPVLASDPPRVFLPTGPAAAPPKPNWNLLFGVTATSQYISRGLAQSSGFAIQPSAELNIGPLYLGYWGSNVSPVWVGADWEHDLSIGLRHSFGPVGIDVGYVRYIYDNGDCCGEVYAKATITPIMPLTLGAAIFHNPDSNATYVEGNVEVAILDQFSLSGAIGSQDGTFSWNAGASWIPRPWLTLDARYHGGPTGGGANKFVISASFATDVNTLMGR